MIIITIIQACLIGIYTAAVSMVIVLITALIRVPGIHNVAYQISRFYCYLVLKTCFVKLRVRGLQHIDPNGQYIFMSNHVSYFDIPAEAVAIPHPMRWVYKKELATIPFFGWAIRGIGHIMVDRHNRSQAMESLESSLSRLGTNTSLMIYPEGTRSMTGELSHFKMGGFHIALISGLPIVPISIRGSRQIMERGVFRIHPGTVEIDIFPPIETGEYGMERASELRTRVREIIQRGVEGTSD